MKEISLSKIFKKFISNKKNPFETHEYCYDTTDESSDNKIEIIVMNIIY